MKHGNFTGLAQKYSEYRPAYSESVLKALISLLNRPISECALADIGAGTGIWTRMLAQFQPQSIVAVEPNDDMRSMGARDSEATKIIWRQGSGEETHLETSSVDMLSMASSFHWVDFEKGCREFHRVLKPEGRFVALWNPRLVEANPILRHLEDYLVTLKPDIKRVSSGRSAFVEDLTEKLLATKLFKDVIYIEGRHSVSVTPEQYVGAWRSVNDVQFQLGPDKFEAFIHFVEKNLANHSMIEVTYLTRTWSALKN